MARGAYIGVNNFEFTGFMWDGTEMDSITVPVIPAYDTDALPYALLWAFNEDQNAYIYEAYNKQPRYGADGSIYILAPYTRHTWMLFPETYNDLDEYFNDFSDSEQDHEFNDLSVIKWTNFDLTDTSQGQQVCSAGWIVQHNNIAKKVKNAYVGIVSDVPIYNEESVTELLTADTITECFEVENYNDYYFEGTGTTFASNNGGVNSSEAWTGLTAKRDMNITLKLTCSTEANYDKYTVAIYPGSTSNNTNIIWNEQSGSLSRISWNGTVYAGQIIEFRYKKDGSSHGNDDKCTFTITAPYIKKTIIGYESKSVARRIKKAYIGIGGVARPCWNHDGIVYYGTIAPLGVARHKLIATTVGNYALFGGGIANAAYKANVDAYNQSLTHSTATSLSVARYDLAATTVGNYALFGGGGGSSYNANVDAYNQSLTRSSATSLSVARNRLAATTVGNYALFGGGFGAKDASGVYAKANVDAYNQSLTRSSATSLSVARDGLVATTVGNYALFGGGDPDGVGYSNVVDAYDASLTRTTPTGLNAKKKFLAATANRYYALFGGGGDSATVDAYDKSLTRMAAPSLRAAKNTLAAVSINDYSLFAGGGYGTLHKTVDVYDRFLSRTITTDVSSIGLYMAGASVGNYALFGGGSTENSSGYRSAVDAYTFIATDK